MPTAVSYTHLDVYKRQLITKPMPAWINLENSPSLFFFENSMQFLDQPGEWYLDEKGILYYIPRKGEDIETTFAEIPILDCLLYTSM